ncbi:MAG: 16S rRNA (cytosine(967)-C(5))-methyltransferase RsmB [Erysipelotrichaceae bacterium]|nr:16S rRNA (cytosine(967)-C(5))-methyltransferase RsmB [Erysipelotrichaceae bacterium]
MKEREIAYQNLCSVIIDRKFSNLVLRNSRETSPFITQLVYGTLRNYRLVREAWSRYAERKLPERIAILLDTACYELLLLDKPQYATVNEWVTVAGRIKSGAYKGVVNAILHRVSSDDLNTGDLAIATSHPDWLVRMWQAHYGEETAEQICRADIREPRVALRANELLTSRDELLKDSRFTAGKLESALYYDGNVIQSEYYENDLVIIQSESSQEVVNNLPIREGMQILDVCAAPGSKSLQMAMKMNNTGRVVANDLYDFRAELISRNAERYGLKNVEVCCHDGTQIDQFYPAGSFDIVLLDGACSGLGTLRHKPEIKIFITDKDIDDLVQLQRRLLEAAALMVAPGGILMYSTCTLNKKENERQVEGFLKDHPHFRLQKQRTVLPMDYDSDGFYWARMARE